MRIKDYKCKCEHNDFFFADKGNQTGIYCSYCGKWLKWADKDEQNLRIKHALDLEKAEQEQKSGKWIDYSDEEGYVECPFCGHATTCEDNIDELHYCFYCGAKMIEPQESEE